MALKVAPYTEYLRDHSDCPWLPFEHTAGVCNRCGSTLTGRRTRWCSDRCQVEWRRQHDWGAAREAAKRRDCRMCQNCGASEHYDWRNPGTRVQLGVNHIVPRVGRGYGFGCHNHLTNLETLCHPCHVEVTKQQAAERRSATSERTGA